MDASLIHKRLRGLALKRAGFALGVHGAAGIGKTHAVSGLLRDAPCAKVSSHATVSFGALLRSLPKPRALPAWVQCFRGADEEWKQNRDDLEISSNGNAITGIPGFGTIAGIGIGTGGMLASAYNSIAGNDKEAERLSLRVQQAYLKSVPVSIIGMAIQDAMSDQRAIDDLDSGKATGPQPNSSYRRDAQIKQFNQDSSSSTKTPATVLEDCGTGYETPPMVSGTA